MEKFREQHAKAHPPALPDICYSPKSVPPGATARTLSFDKALPVCSRYTNGLVSYQGNVDSSDLGATIFRMKT
jgi:hypothetical protein